MGMPRRLTKARLTEIFRRQDPPQWGKGYEPAIKATREEAPSTSRFGTVWSELLQRDIATLSGPERRVLYIVLYSPLLFELQEQRMLPALPSAHPLNGHPSADGLQLPPLRGTLRVAAELNFLALHPTVQQRDGDDEARESIPGCYVGDFLLFLRDRDGPYCVNLNIKSNRGEFEIPAVGVTLKTNKQRASARERARHEIERTLYADVAIRTVEIATDELPEILVANLGQLVLWQKRQHCLTDDQVGLVLNAFQTGLERELAALDVIRTTELTHRIGCEDQKIVLFQAIFKRRLRIDLFTSHLFIDKPMRAESMDVLTMFSRWFER